MSLGRFEAGSDSASRISSWEGDSYPTSGGIKNNLRGRSLMLVSSRLGEHYTLLVGLLVVARRFTKVMGLDSAASVAEMCRAIGCNRTAAYDQGRRVLGCLEMLAAKGPGRPCKVRSAAGVTEEELKLTIRTLEFQQLNPGAVLKGGGRRTYSSVFRRFVLLEKDQWMGQLDRFAMAIRVPLGTVRDWLRHEDDESLLSFRRPPMRPLPEATPRLVQTVVSRWADWQGSLRSFVRQEAPRLGLSQNFLRRIIQMMQPTPRRRSSIFRYRGTTRRLQPGTLLVTDGKNLTVKLTESGREQRFNWQGIVDQTTGCDTAVVVSEEEGATSVLKAVQRSLSGPCAVRPAGLVHDGKACYRDTELRLYLESEEISMIPCSRQRPQNKAILEGSFGLFEQRVGKLVLDDSSFSALIRSAVSEVVRAYTAATNTVPRQQWAGRSRQQVLRAACLEKVKDKDDLDFVTRLRIRHSENRRRKLSGDTMTFELLGRIFRRFEFEGRTKEMLALRRYLARYESAAVQRAAGLLAGRLRRGGVDHAMAHRYFAKLVQTQQEQLELERAAEEFLDLSAIKNCHLQEMAVAELARLRRESNSQEGLALQLAERAARSESRLVAAFWKRELVALVTISPQVLEAVRRHLVRLYEAPAQARLSLLEALAH